MWPYVSRISRINGLLPLCAAFGEHHLVGLRRTATTRDQPTVRKARKVTPAFTRHRKKVRPTLGGGPAAREPGLGTGRGGDVTGNAELLVRCQCAVAVALDEFGSPSETHTLGSAWDWGLAKREPLSDHSKMSPTWLSRME